MITRDLPPGDDYLIRCPRLGHQIYFSYCRTENMGLPCFKTLDCWFQHFSVEEYLRNEMKPEEWERVFARQGISKVQSLIGLIEEAKKKKKGLTAGLILAAGSSTRMGSPKQLLDRKGNTLLDHVLGEALKSELAHVVLVLGYRAEEIKRGLKTDLNHPKLKTIVNRKWEDGMSTSIIAGLSEVQKGYDHCMVLLADMPNISATLINRLIHDYLSSGLTLGAIKKGEIRSLPAIFGRALYEELHQLKGDVGARDLFIKYKNNVCLVEPGVEYNDLDIDTPEDYADFMRSLDES